MKIFLYIFISYTLFFHTLLFAATVSISISDSNVAEGDTDVTMSFDFTCSANITAGDKVDYTLVSLSAEANVDYVVSSGTISFATNSCLDTNLNVTIIGDNTPEIAETFKVILSNPSASNSKLNNIDDGEAIGTILNDDIQAWPPIFVEIPDQFAIVNVNYELNSSVYVTEVNDDNVTYSITNPLPSGLNFDTSTGIISGTPTVEGEHNITVTATDKDGYVSDTFLLTINSGFCYEYAYQQQNVYFTEENIDNHPPVLDSGTRYIIANDSNYPIMMTLYIRNQSNIDISDLNMTVSDINTTQVEYIADTTYVKTKNNLQGTLISDSPYSSDSTFAEIGDVEYGSYFYLDYQLEPQSSLLDTPIDAEISFKVYDSQSYTLELGNHIPLCSTSVGSGYTPVDAIFTVVHKDYYTYTGSGSGTQYYNLPTQVTNRPGNFKIIALEPDSDTLKSIAVVPVAVELIDVDLYGGDVEAACKEPRSAISPKVWLVFDENTTSLNFDETTIQYAIDNGMVTPMSDGTILSSPADFYKKARKNVAFRTSYNNSGNDDDIVTLSVKTGTNPPEYNVDNFSDAVKNKTCGADIDGDESTTDTIAAYCDNASAAATMTPDELRLCMECAFGLSTTLTCSRDNFAIRPEAFNIVIKDQNQSNGNNGSTISTNSNLSAGYSYDINVTATTHSNNNPSDGYSRVYTASTSHQAQLKWEGPSSGCNDDSNQSISMIFNDGLVSDTNISRNQVGNFNINILDSLWTSVDSDPAQMSHHSGTYFLNSSTPDCIQNSTVTASVNSLAGSATPLIGCNISSEHNNSANSLVYKDYNVTFHPYKFDMSNINISYGENNSTSFPATPFIYMSDMDSDEQMSIHLNGFIRAAGYNDSNLTNFVDGCYAKDVNLTITSTLPTGISENLVYRYHGMDLNGVDLSTQDGNITTTTTTISIPSNDFNSTLNGRLNTALNLNIDKNISNAINPQDITYSAYTASCANESDCTMNSDLTSQATLEGNAAVLPYTVRHYYGRSHATRNRFENPLDQDALVYYECSRTLLPGGVDSNSTDDPRWFINPDHNSTYGIAGSVTRKPSATIVTQDTAPTGNHQDFVRLDYDSSRGFPYKATMRLNSSSWLLYNKYNQSATSNEFEIEYVKGSSSWGGVDDANSTSQTGGASKTNRRIMW